jgi:hypothetical protein
VQEFVAATSNATSIATKRAEGVNASEQQLNRIADAAFLALWTYPDVRNDKGIKDGKGPGQQVCDLLVVFENDIIIFSVKASEFPSTGDLHVDWNRWFGRAVEEALDQIRGAQRWIKAHPDRLFLDRACTQPIPVRIPNPAVARIHRIAVVQGAATRCRAELGGRGSLRIVPDIIGPQHRARFEDGGQPFAVGQLDPNLGFVHVFDETSLESVLREIDTISDFINYLTWKEQLVRDGRLASVPGEPELLAYYLERLRETNRYIPELPAEVDRLTLDEGIWDAFATSIAREARRRANEPSYLIDRLIERTSDSAYSGMQAGGSSPGVAGAANIMRFLAREPRTRRRIVGMAVADLFESTPESHFAATTVVHPSQPGDPYYVILLVSPHHLGQSYDEYCEMRLWMLDETCRAVRYQFPHAEDIVGIATDLSSGRGSSELMVYYDGRTFIESDAIAAQELIEQTGALQNLRHTVGMETYFPGHD